MSVVQKYMGYPPRRLAVLCIYSAASGTCFGKIYSNLKKHPGTETKIIKISLATGLFAGTCGLTFGLLKNVRPLSLFLTQNMYVTLVTVIFLNVRSVISNAEYHLPTQKDYKRMNDLSISTVSAGITGGLIGFVRTQGIVFFTTGAVMGSITGFFGHLLYDKVRALRIKYFLQQQYPDLLSKHRECEEWMLEQTMTNPDYTGPKKSEPYIVQWLNSLWGDYYKTKKSLDIDITT
ncbi:uncharacterized protein LOC100197481 isoform X2 [Hydra vulgaris]|uniref:Uncharacterized protein LOC100197481 isoform X2 n=1 Tax=Hydra vulgaris TaxID=6087 RepID=A0ABM4CY58_HYDVU